MIKEAKTLLGAGFFVTVIWCPLSLWADQSDAKLFNDYPNINWVKAGYHAKFQPIGYWYARVRQKIWQSVYKIVGDQYDSAIKSLVLYSQELTSIALDNKADLYIGHNLGALPAIVKAAKKSNAKSIFDFEDFHRGEAAEGTLQTKMVKEIENFYIPLVDSITTASSSITEAYQTIFKKKNITTINNCFPLEYASEQIKVIPKIPLKLFWFSQYVGKQRGLETILAAMSLFPKGEITLTLLGSASRNIKHYFNNLMNSYNLKTDQLVFLDSVPEEQIASFASMFHIGLASEFVHNQNRDLCLTNKLFMYLLAGNVIVATDTSAQKNFLTVNPGIGSLYEQENVIDLFRVLKNYNVNPDLLDSHRKNALELGRIKFNWNIEKCQFLKKVEIVLSR